MFVVRSRERLATQLLPQAARKSPCSSRLPRLLFCSLPELCESSRGLRHSGRAQDTRVLFHFPILPSSFRQRSQVLVEG